MPSGFTPTLAMSFILRLRSAEHETGSRLAPVRSQRARTHGLAKERANKPITLQLQGVLRYFFNSGGAVASLLQ